MLFIDNTHGVSSAKFDWSKLINISYSVGLSER